MNIAYVVPEFVTEVSGGGLASYIYQISGILAELGHNITIIVTSEENEDYMFAHNIRLVRVNIDISNVDMDIHGSIFREWSRVLNKKLIEVHESGGNFDVVHYSNLTAPGYYRTDIPSVVRISSDLPLLRGAEHLDFDPNKNYECIKATDYLEELSLMKADAVFGPSYFLADIIGKRTGKKIHVIESPFVDKRLEKDCSILEKNLNGKKYMIYHGTLKLLKGIKVIGDGIYEILKRHKDMCFVFAGDSKDWVGENGEDVNPVNYIQEQAREFCDRLIFLGPLPREQLYPIIENSECVVLPSRVDNFPNAAIEAMSYGKIVIGSEKASFDQLITTGVNGFLIKNGDVDDLIEKIDLVLSLSPKEREQISRKAKERIASMDPAAIADQVLDLYKNAITDPDRIYDRDYYDHIEKLLIAASVKKPQDANK